jgi:hypothetical protein
MGAWPSGQPAGGPSAGFVGGIADPPEPDVVLPDVVALDDADPPPLPLDVALEPDGATESPSDPHAATAAARTIATAKAAGAVWSIFSRYPAARWRSNGAARPRCTDAPHSAGS